MSDFALSVLCLVMTLVIYYLNKRQIGRAHV